MYQDHEEDHMVRACKKSRYIAVMDRETTDVCVLYAHSGPVPLVLDRRVREGGWTEWTGTIGEK